MSIATLRDALQTRINTLSGTVGYDVATGNERISQPVSIVFPRPGGGQLTSCDTHEYRFTVEVHVPLRMGLERAQNALDELIDPKAVTGIRAAIEGDKTLAGAASSLRVDDFEVYSFSTLNDVPTLAARVPVTVLTA